MERNVRLWTLNEKQYPGIEPFFGLAQLTSQQLNELVHTKGKPITKEQIREAVAGWNAYTVSNPIEIETWITTTNGSLPFLKKAFETHLTYFPSSQNGLNEVENLIFNFINIRTCSFTEIFQRKIAGKPAAANFIGCIFSSTSYKFIFQENSRT